MSKKVLRGGVFYFESDIAKRFEVGHLGVFYALPYGKLVRWNTNYCWYEEVTFDDLLEIISIRNFFVPEINSSYLDVFSELLKTLPDEFFSEDLSLWSDAVVNTIVYCMDSERFVKLFSCKNVFEEDEI